MALTNFAALTPEQKLVWSREVWKDARDMAFISKFIGTSQMSAIQRITELTKTERGEQVIMHLLADLVEDGVVGDNEREGVEEEMKTYNDIITIDLISHGVRQKGKLAEQKTVVKFREHARDRLSYWLANRMDQLAFLTLSGISYAENNDGSARSSGAFSTLAFAADISAPTANRYRNWTAASGLVAGNTATVLIADTLTYAAMVDINVFAKTHYIKAMQSGGKEFYIVFIRPEGLAQLKKDADYQRAVITGAPRDMKNNPWFSGGIVTVDGLVFHEHRLVYNTLGKTSGADKWGANNTADGSHLIVCGTQALGMADLGSPEWSEKMFQYDSSPGINVDKMFGFLKPKFFSIYDKTVEDFGTLVVNYAIGGTDS